jgi:hypothetical protein
VCDFLCLCTGRGLATSWPPVQGVLSTVLDLVTEVKRKVHVGGQGLNCAVEPNLKKLETVSNISFSSTSLELYSEIALSRKPFGIGHMYISMFCLLRMTDTMTYQNIGFPPGTLCIYGFSVPWLCTAAYACVYRSNGSRRFANPSLFCPCSLTYAYSQEF